jgi:hypothetical protein
MVRGPLIIRSEKTNERGKKARYKPTTTQSIAPTTMLAVKVNNLYPDLATVGVAPEELLVVVPVAVVAVEL